MIVVLLSDNQLPEYTATPIAIRPPNYMVQPSPGYSDEPPPEYSNESSLGYSDEPPPEYSNEPSPGYSDEPPPEYSNEPSPGYSDEPPPEYSDEPSPGYSDEPPPEYSDEPSLGYSDEPPQEYSNEPSPGYSDEPSLGYSDEPPPEYSNEPSPGYSDELSPGYSDEQPPEYSNDPSTGYSDEPSLGYSDEPPPEYSNEPSPAYSAEAPLGYSDEAPPVFSNEQPIQYSDTIPDTSSDVLRHTIHEQSINTFISTISYAEQNRVLTLRTDTYDGSSPIRHQSLSPFPITDIYTLADSEQTRRGEMNTDSREASQVCSDQTTRQIRTAGNSTAVSGSNGENEMKFRRGYNLMCMVGIASLWCCFTGFLALYFAITKEKYLDKDELNKAKTSETIAILLLIVTYVIFCVGIFASIGFIIQSTIFALLPIPLFILMVCVISTWCAYQPGRVTMAE